MSMNEHRVVGEPDNPALGQVVAAAPHTWLKEIKDIEKLEDGTSRRVVLHRRVIAWEVVPDDLMNRGETLEPWVLLGTIGERWKWSDDTDDAEILFSEDALPRVTAYKYDEDGKLVESWVVDEHDDVIPPKSQDGRRSA